MAASDLAELDPPYLQDDDLGNKDQLELDLPPVSGTTLLPRLSELLIEIGFIKFTISESRLEKTIGLDFRT